MEIQYLWPLVGVVLGSFLTFVISGLQSRADKRRKIATALSKLLAIYFQLRTVRSAIDGMLEHSESFQDFERYRYGVMQRHLLEPALLASLKDSVSDISGLFPIAALDLENLIQMLIRDKKGSLAGSSKVEEIYLKFFCIYEVSLDVTEKELVRYIRWLGWKHGIYTYLNIRINTDTHSHNVPTRSRV